MPSLLLEIGCEELPAWACDEAATQLRALCIERVEAEPIAVFVGPRRLAILTDDLPEQRLDETVYGPPETAAKRPDGTCDRRLLAPQR